MQSDWKDRKDRFPINYLFDGMCYLHSSSVGSSFFKKLKNVSCEYDRVDRVVVFVFVLFLGVFDTRR